MAPMTLDLEGHKYLVVATYTSPEDRRPGALRPLVWRGATALLMGALVLVAVGSSRHSARVAFVRSGSQPAPEEKRQLLAVPEDAWTRVLRTHVAPAVRDGVQLNQVDYAGVTSDPDFHVFLQSLETVNLASLSKQAFYATLMNAYNALAIKMVIDHACQGPPGRCAPLASLGDVNKAGGGPWKLPAGKIGGTMYSLQQIEDTLRRPGRFPADARLHACITCASVSCPDIPTEAFRPEAVDSQMAAHMQAFLSNPQKGFALDQTTGLITLSMIFKWNQADFIQEAGSVVNFIRPYVPAAARAYIDQHPGNHNLAYFPWDRNLNGVAPVGSIA